MPLISGGEALLLHGTMRDPLDEIEPNDSDDRVIDALNDDPADVVLLAGSHQAHQRAIGDVVVTDVGSVGACPSGRIADFTVVEPYLDKIEVFQDWVEY